MKKAQSTINKKKLPEMEKPKMQTTKWSEFNLLNLFTQIEKSGKSQITINVLESLFAAHDLLRNITTLFENIEKEELLTLLKCENVCKLIDYINTNNDMFEYVDNTTFEYVTELTECTTI